MPLMKRNDGVVVEVYKENVKKYLKKGWQLLEDTYYEKKIFKKDFKPGYTTNIRKDYTKKEVLDEIKMSVVMVLNEIHRHFKENKEPIRLTKDIIPTQRYFLTKAVDEIFMYGNDDDIKDAVNYMWDDIEDRLPNSITLTTDPGNSSEVIAYNVNDPPDFLIDDFSNKLKRKNLKNKMRIIKFPKDDLDEFIVKFSKTTEFNLRKQFEGINWEIDKLYQEIADHDPGYLKWKYDPKSQKEIEIEMDDDEIVESVSDYGLYGEFETLLELLIKEEKKGNVKFI